MFFRTVLGCAVTAVLLGACGSKEPAQTVAKPARPLVTLSRAMGIDPAVDEIAIDVDGGVVVRRLRGGAGGRVARSRLRAAALSRLRARLARLERGRHPYPHVTPDRWLYTLRAGSQEPRYFMAGAVSARARPVISQLNALIDASARHDPSVRSR
jgi:hypothetical protein